MLYCFCNFAAEGEAFINCKVRVKSQDGLYSGEMLWKSGVKLAEEMGCWMRRMVKRKLLSPVMSHNGFIVEGVSEKIQDCQ